MASQAPNTDWLAVVREIGPEFAERAAAHDLEGTFVEGNYQTLRQRKLFSAGVPADLGGGGATLADICDILRELAHYCGSTSLALSMHQHLVAAMIWRWNNGQPVEPMLRRLAAEELVLVSTGASDWVNSVGKAEKVAGGYRVSARKIFGSGGPMGDIAVSSAPYDGPDDGPSVLHFPVPLSAEGVRFEHDWDTLGMRGTGSNTIVFENVFVPDAAIAVKRPADKWHPVWNVALTVAVPIYMSPYLGLAEAAEEKARVFATKTKQNDPHTPYLLGELQNTLTIAQMAWREMVASAQNNVFKPENDKANYAVIRKTICAKAVIDTVQKAMEVCGGASYFRGFGLERLLRDVYGAHYHPLPEKKQLVFTGRMALGLDPIG